MKKTTDPSVSYFKAHCTRIRRELEKRPPQWRIRVANRGRVVATIAPGDDGAPVDPAVWLGSLNGSVIRFEELFAPAAGPGDWSATNS